MSLNPFYRSKQIVAGDFYNEGASVRAAQNIKA
jgi:hypothetical protein